MLDDRTWRPELVLRLLLGIFASMSLGVFLVQGLEYLLPAGPWTKFLLFCLGTLSLHGVSLMLTHLFLRDQGLTWTEAFGLNKPRRGRAILLAFVVAALILPIALSLSEVSMKLMELMRWKVEVQPAVQALQSSQTIPQRTAFAVVALVFAPVVEEVIFRGVLYTFLTQIGYKKAALWCTSLLFALSHANVMTFIPLTFIGVVLTLLYRTTGNLLSNIVAHSLFNGANLILWLVNEMSKP